MKTLIIGDIHENVPRLVVLRHLIEQADRVVCLGDYFDTFGDEAYQWMIDWIISHIEDDTFTFLLGNHDVHYIGDSPLLMCSGYLQYKKKPIQDALKPYLHRFRLETQVGRFTCTHAGWHPKTLKYRAALSVAMEALANGQTHPIFGAGYARWGNQPVGGPLWLDWDREFTDIQSLPQIVGHTFDQGVRKKGDSYCIDTGLQACLMYDSEDDSIKIVTPYGKEISDDLH